MKKYSGYHKCNVCKQFVYLTIHMDIRVMREEKKRLKRPRTKWICNNCKYSRDGNLGYAESDVVKKIFNITPDKY